MLTNGNQKRIRVSDKIDEKNIETWNAERPVIITAGTGVGKSYFIKNILYKYAKNNGQKILMLIHRKLCVEQFSMEIEEDGKSDVIDIMTYQKLEKSEMYEIDLKLSEYKYIVCDEFHYFISDASFNNTTDISFKKIMGMRNAIKIFMSATGDNVEEYIQKIVKVKPINYRIPFDWSFIATLNFYHNDASLSEFAKALVEKGQKGIFFIQQATKAYAFYQEFREYSLFNCSKQNEKYYKYVNEDKICQMLKAQKFEENILITTSCMDAGVNIIDSSVRFIFIDIKDIGSLIQCMGRKRIQFSEDRIHVFIKVINNQQLGGLETNAKRQLEMADYLKNHTTEEWVKRYPRQIDKTQTVYDDIINDGNKETCTKKVNDLMYHKKKLYIEEIHHMKNYGDFGYCKYLARKFNKYDTDTEFYDYAIISGNYGLENYLNTHLGQIMLQRKDRKELIKTMDIRRDGHLKSSKDILNAALKEDNLQYRIEEFETSKIVNGKKKKYKSAWRIVTHNWET
ncbi:MAG: DNA helicase [Blautia producta]|nr:DNA helicase [Blautia producta]MDU5380745.1 DNA helicase [Blautia producta]MDU6882069.1 DNA helicase [Blautia producta]